MKIHAGLFLNSNCATGSPEVNTDPRAVVRWPGKDFYKLVCFHHSQDNQEWKLYIYKSFFPLFILFCLVYDFQRQRPVFRRHLWTQALNSQRDLVPSAFQSVHNKVYQFYLRHLLLHPGTASTAVAKCFYRLVSHRVFKAKYKSPFRVTFFPSFEGRKSAISSIISFALQ